MTRRGRSLRPEEEKLWRKVAERTERIAPETPFLAQDASNKEAKAQSDNEKLFVALPGRHIRAEAATSLRLSPTIGDELRGKPVQMDKKAFTKMKRGKLRPEGKLDLHGMTLDRAHPALIGFILSAQQQRKRLVLVVTGKGKDRDEGGPIPVRNGVLRHQVPQWLSSPPLSSAVLQVAQAHVSHGGGGAYYVYLRRAR